MVDVNTEKKQISVKVAAGSVSANVNASTLGNIGNIPAANNSAVFWADKAEEWAKKSQNYANTAQDMALASEQAKNELLNDPNFIVIGENITTVTENLDNIINAASNAQRAEGFAQNAQNAAQDAQYWATASKYGAKTAVFDVNNWVQENDYYILFLADIPEILSIYKSVSNNNYEKILNAKIQTRTNGSAIYSIAPFKGYVTYAYKVFGGNVHIQDIPAAEWIIEHNTNSYPSVIPVDETGTVMICTVQYLNSNVVKLSFTTEVNGKAYIN